MRALHPSNNCGLKLLDYHPVQLKGFKDQMQPVFENPNFMNFKSDQKFVNFNEF